VHNSWKGLVVGGLTGAVVGVALDLINSAAKQAARGAEQVRGHAPQAAEWLQEVTEKAAEWVKDADVPDHVREVAHRILGSDVATSASSAATKVAEAAKDYLHPNE
jgi:hypothetical protein